MKRFMIMIVALGLMLSAAATATATAGNQYNWIEGGQKVNLGSIATVDLDPEFIFLDGENTKKMSRDVGEPVSGQEIGSIYPIDDNQSWAVFFEYEESGHIKDAEKEDIDGKALLKSYKQGTEEQNKSRQPGEKLFVTGWDIEPFYDEKTHNLTWSLLIEDEKKETFLNYNTRLLTRQGNISVILVTDPQNREADKKVLSEKILSKLQVNEGQRYTDFNEATDKVAEYGLSALILGGAGLAIAKKTGLLVLILAFAKKFGVVIVAVIAGLWGWIRKKKKSDNPPPANTNDETLNS
ncbi:DUF2167 domain-containing protein [Paenibacillus turpanensis]|uniref:DUF2167 domain-containing protein n=1 Tax=Paenibacillus turpanensis TaxID=2689078 RepID=UPI00140BBE10|nr:DUF2167 domain-containing protein [Paenibacillus turpanensis]